MKKALGKGLNALLPSPSPAGEQAVFNINIDMVRPNPEQPRRDFDEEAIGRLAESIAAVGIVQPIIVADEGAYYKIIAGERRWRAARIAGLAEVPAIVRDFTMDQTVEVALIENLQRQDLNPIEEAQGYERLMSEYGYTQDRLARSTGRSRSAIANTVRLLRLSERIRGLISGRRLSPGHARALLTVDSDERREELADKILELDLNVRQAEALAAAAAGGWPLDETALVSECEAADETATEHTGESADENAGAADNENTGEATPDGNAEAVDDGAAEAVDDAALSVAYTAALRNIEDALRSRFNTRVALQRGKAGTGGKIVIEYYGDEELQRLLDQWGIGNL